MLLFYSVKSMIFALLLLLVETPECCQILQSFQRRYTEFVKSYLPLEILFIFLLKYLDVFVG